MKNLVLLPTPKSIEWQIGELSLKEKLGVFLPEEWQFLQKHLEMLCIQTEKAARTKADICFVQLQDIAEEGYVLSITEKKIEISASSIAGAFYGFTTLVQLVLQAEDNRVPCGVIKDEPSLKIRGVMLDISRDKVPQLDTVLDFVRLMPLLRLNHLQLYIEGFSFAYPSFEHLWKDETPFTPEDFKTLDALCKEYFVDLVPCQNAFGHMAKWLQNDEFKHLAESEKGLFPAGALSLSTLDPANPGSVSLVEKMTEDLLPNFTSKYYNMCLDEPFELGKGKSKKRVKKEGIGQVYLDYALKMREIATQHGKEMMIWGDIVSSHPEIVEHIPKDVTILEWGYEAQHPFEEHAKKFKQAGLKFCLCTGTNTWSTYAGLTDNMLGTAESAAQAAKKYGAEGIIVTDWGDFGHLQYFTASYAGIAASADAAWSLSVADKQNLATWLDNIVYLDKAGVMGRFTLELGNYYTLEEYPTPSRPLLFWVLAMGLSSRLKFNLMQWAFMNILFKNFAPPSVLEYYIGAYKERKKFQYKPMMNLLDRLEKELGENDMQRPDAELVQKEWLNTILLIRILQNCRKWIEEKAKIPKSERKAFLNKLAKDIDVFYEKHLELWNARNRAGGIKSSTASILKLKKQVKHQSAKQ